MTSSQKTISLVAVSAIVGFVALRGCNQYGKVDRPAYETATALYSICNRRDEAALKKLGTYIEAETRNGKLSSREADWLIEIVKQAEAGNWSEASSHCRRLLEGQVEENR